MSLQEARESLREPARADGVEEADVHLAGLRRHGALGVGDGVAEVVEEPLRPDDEAPPRLVQPDAASDPLEERHADLALEASDLARDRRLLGAEDVSRVAEVLQAGDLEEGPQQIGIDALHASISLQMCC